MEYTIALKKRSYDKDGEWFHFHESFLPGFRIPERVEPLLKVDFADRMNLCEHCNLDTHCHPIAADGSKFCTMLFWDAVKPSWRLEEIV